MWNELIIKNLRKELKMTQEEFSEFTHIPKRSIENWEASARKPPHYIIELIQYKALRELKERQCATCIYFWNCPKTPNRIIEENMCDKYEDKTNDEYDRIETYPITNETW